MITSMTRLMMAGLLWGLLLPLTSYAQPQYEIISLGLAGESVSGGQAISEDGQFAAGFTNNDPFLWQSGPGSTGLPSAAGRPFSTPWGVNNAGTIAGIGATTFFGSDALPILWQKGAAIPLSLPSGQTLGRAYAINNSDLVVGSVNGGSLEQAATFTPGGPGTILTQTLAGGVLRTAYGVNDAGRIVGQALDPNNAAVIKGFYLDPGDTQASDVGALTGLGHNSAIAFDVSSNGLITGSSSINGGADGRPFLWSETNGMTEIPLPTDTSTGSGRGVNASGWVVGTAGGVFAIPFLNDGTATYRLHDLIAQGGTGWDLQTGTSNGAFSIADNGTIVGRGLLNGQLTAFAMVLIPSGPVLVPVDSFVVIRGMLSAGGVEALEFSDDVDLSVRRSPTGIQAVVELELKGISPTETPTMLSFTLEAAMFARSTVNQSIWLFDYVADDFEQLDIRQAATFTDLVTTVMPTGDLSRFVEPVTGCVKARVVFQSVNPRQQFTANIDQIIWQIE
jgi:uncharacterized membrane protein